MSDDIGTSATMRKTALTALVICTLAVSSGALAQATKPSMTLCSGPDEGMYQRAAQELVRQGQERINYKITATRGSVENLDMLAEGKCDAAPVQNDALRVYKEKYSRDAGRLERAGPLYAEYVHLICNRKSGVSRITDLRDGMHPIAIGPDRSGSSVTWDSLVLADKDYSKAPTLPLAGLRALEKVKIGDEAACMIFTSALNNPFVRADVSAAGEYVSLVPADDGDFGNAKDEKGHPIYQYTRIPAGVYRRVQSGLFSSSVPTVAVDAIWVVRSAWIDANERAYNYFLDAKNKALPGIKLAAQQW